MDFDFLEFENVLEKFFLHIPSLSSSIIDKTFGVGVDKDRSDSLGSDVVLVNEPDWLECVRSDYFEVGVAAFEVLKALDEGD